MKKLLLTLIIALIASVALVASPATYAYYSHNSYTDSYPNPNQQFHPKNPDYYNGNQRLTLKTRADIERATKPNVHYDEYSDDYYSCDWQYNKNLGTWVCNKRYPSYSATSQAIRICPFGYTRHPIQQTCELIGIPVNGRLTASGDAWQCNAGYHMNYAQTGCDRDQTVYAKTSSGAYAPVGLASSATASSYASATSNTANYISQPESIQITKYVYVYDENSGSTPSSVLTTYYPSALPSTGMGLEWVLFAGSLGTYRVFRRKK